MNVEGKVVLITGGTNGIGFSVAKELLKNKAKGVSLVDIADNTASLLELVSEYGQDRAIFVKTDVTIAQELEDAFEKTVNFYQQLDIVINNAGISNEQDWEKMLDVNLNAVIRGSYLAMKTYLPKYKSGEEGTILNTASVLGLQPTQIAPVYCVSKHGIVILGRSLSGDEFYRTYKVRVLTICPGLTLSGLHSGPVSIRSVFPHKIKEEMKKMGVELQPFETIARAFIKVINEGKNGSIWVAENGEPAQEVVIPLKDDLKKKKAVAAPV